MSTPRLPALATFGPPYFALGLLLIGMPALPPVLGQTLSYSHALAKAISPRGSGPRVNIGVEPPHCGSLECKSKI
jgi:hypothetical protein